MKADISNAIADPLAEAIDLTECEQEPIRHLGFIQPHGQLLAFNSNEEITNISENFAQHFPINASDALGRSLGQVLGAKSDTILKTILHSLNPGQVHHELWDGKSEQQSLWIHQRNSRYILEWESTTGVDGKSETAAEVLESSALAQIRNEPHIHRQAQLAADLTAGVTNYDRVMVYRFHPDWSGEVIAEVRQPQAEPFLGLRYPASDIPPQARALYTENLLRVIVDVHGTPIRILSLAGNDNPLDLTTSLLRAVSPYHIEYLKNMHVGATATASILVNGLLWGLIACHHDRRKGVGPKQRKGLSDIAQAFSVGIGSAQFRARQLVSERVKVRATVLSAAMPDASSVLPEILFGSERLRNLLRCCGTAVWTAKGLVRMGDAPSASALESYAVRLLSGPDDIVALDSRTDLAARLGLAPQNSSLAGLIAIVISRKPGLILFGFRLETIREITWGGDINHPVLRNEQTGARGPRRSFAHYTQSVLGKADCWAEENMDAAQSLLEVLRGKASTPEQVSDVIAAGFAKIRFLAIGEYPIHHSFLDAIGDGVSLLFGSNSGDTTLRFANQILLDVAQTSAEEGAALPTANDLLLAIGLPIDLLNQCEFEPRQVVIPNIRDGLRHYLVERKLALELQDGSGDLSLTAPLFTDTTRQVRACEALQAAEEKSRQLTFLKSSFLANMSHEIRTPMNGILGMVQLLQNTRKDPEQQRYLDIIQQSGDLMLKIINDILDLSKIEAGFTEIEKVPFDLTEVVEGVVDLMRARAYEKSIGISAYFDAPPPCWYMGDSFRLRQVILNIVGNAIKFTTAGQITVSVRRQDLTQQLASVEIAVTDTGVGIAEHELSHVFDKFHQADQSTTRKHSGTGLGLAISRELVTLMGGSISLSSVLGVGSTFTVKLALNRARDPAQARATSDLVAASNIAQSVAPGIGRRILVAEDDFTNQIVIEEILKTKGFEVAIADSGIGVLELMADRWFDLILMDCHMPGLDGYQTTARIRANEAPGRHIPIVALTASALSDDRQRCLDAGMDDYIAKPVDIQTLWDVLRKWNCFPREPAVTM